MARTSLAANDLSAFGRHRMRLFFTQLSWEFTKLWSRRRTWLGFVGCLLWHIAGSALLRVPDVRLHIQRDVWKMRWDFDQTFSGLTTAAHLTGEAMTAVGTVALALVMSDLLAQEAEDGSLRTVLCRPISRFRLFCLKLIVGITYAALLAVFIAYSGLIIGLLFEGPGPLIMVALHESVLGAFDYHAGLERYFLATALLAVSAASGGLLTFAFSCFPIKPITAAALSLTVFFTDNMIRATPQAEQISPHCLSTRMIAWRQVFNSEIPVSRVKRLYTELLEFDAALIVGGWLAFRRRDFKP